MKPKNNEAVAVLDQGAVGDDFALKHPDPSGQADGKRRKRHPREVNRVPVILSNISRTCVKMKVHAEAPDAKRFREYCQYAYESQLVPGQFSIDEMETRLNAVAWNAVWKSDSGFQVWLEAQKEIQKVDGGCEP